MPKRDTTPIIEKPLKVDNFTTNPVRSTGFDLSNGKREHRHLERRGNGVVIVSDGIVDEDALIQSEKCNAGLENLIKMHTLRYGTLENAIKRNEDKQMYADVSKIPTSIAEQEQYVKNIEEDVYNLCNKLGISKEELLKSNQENLAKLLASKQQTTTEEGGNQ